MMMIIVIMGLESENGIVGVGENQQNEGGGEKERSWGEG
jgi:hypothetical protein